MSLDFIFAIIFYSLIILYFLTHRKHFSVENKIFLMYRTKIGLKLMDKFSGILPKVWTILGRVGILVGFVGMVLIFFMLTSSLIEMLITPSAKATVGLVLPGIRIPGAPFFVPFWQGIIAIFVVASVHEFSHGIFARLFKIKVKSSGVALFGPILAAFVEPDEKQMKRKKKVEQLSILAAGPFSNLITGGIVFLLLLFFFIPTSATIFDYEGVMIGEIQEDYPLDLAGARPGEAIRVVNDVLVEDLNNFIILMEGVKPGDEVMIQTNRTTYRMIATTNPEIDGKGYIGVIPVPEKVIINEQVREKYGSFLPNAFFWITKLFTWIFMLSIGIGLINLLPLGPVDGGRMFHIAALQFFKKENADNIFKFASIISLLLIVLNLILPYLKQLFIYLF